MPFALNDINGWPGQEMGCVPTALCAISGRTPADIAAVLQQAAAQRGEAIGPELRRDYSPRDWKPAIELMGGQANIVEDYSNDPYAVRETIDQTMARVFQDGRLRLIVGVDPDSDVTHVFATQGGFVIDTYTGGKRVPFTGAPGGYLPFRTKYVLTVT